MELGVRLEGRDEDQELDAQRDTFISNAPGSMTPNTFTWATMRLEG